MRTKVLGLILLLVALVLTACAMPDATASSGGAAGDCPAATEGTALLTNEEGGYCLLYPSDFTVRAPIENERIVEGPVLEIGRAMAFIQVEEAGGRTAEQVADELLAPLAQLTPTVEGASFNIERSTISIDGEQAVVLDNMPGQDINRQVLFVHDGRLYNLMFVPADENLGDAYAQMETLYETVTGSFRFLE